MPTELDVALFDASFYLGRGENADLAAAGVITPTQGFAHWFETGLAEGREFSPLITIEALFDEAAYAANPQVSADIAAGLAANELDHYIRIGSALDTPNGSGGAQFNPNAFFDPAAYRNANPDIVAAVDFNGNSIDPFVHYLQFGEDEVIRGDRSLDGLIGFNPAFYEDANGDVAGFVRAGPDGNAGLVTFFQHYVANGQFEDRAGEPGGDTGGDGDGPQTIIVDGDVGATAATGLRIPVGIETTTVTSAFAPNEDNNFGSSIDDDAYLFDGTLGSTYRFQQIGGTTEIFLSERTFDDLNDFPLLPDGSTSDNVFADIEIVNNLLTGETFALIELRGNGIVPDGTRDLLVVLTLFNDFSGDYTFTLSKIEEFPGVTLIPPPLPPAEQDVADTQENAPELIFGQAYQSSIEMPGDEDVFRFTAEPNIQYRIILSGPSDIENNPFLSIRGVAGDLLFNESFGILPSPDENNIASTQIVVSNEQVIFLELSFLGTGGGTTGDYTILVEEVGPAARIASFDDDALI